MTAAILLRIMRSIPINDPNSFNKKQEIDNLANSLILALKSLVYAICSSVAIIVLLLNNGS